MNRLLRPSMFCLFLAMICLSGQGYGGDSQAEPPSGMAIAHRARSLRPGEVVLLTLESRKPVQRAQGSVFGKSFPFFAGRDGRRWQGLIGIDLDSKPGRYTVTLGGAFADGAPFRLSHILVVGDRIFPTRRLTLEEKYVTPPKAVEVRIDRESRRLGQLFETVTPQRLWSGSFALPLPGTPRDNFGNRSILNGKPRSPHSGVDFSAGSGTPIEAPNAGKIVLAADLYFTGNTVVIDHGMGLYSLMAHLSRFSVREGEPVKRGQIIGLVGATGRATGPHLHWTVRLAGTRVDPLSLVALLKPSKGM